MKRTHWSINFILSLHIGIVSADASLNQWGEIGLLQLPSARFTEAGTLSFGLTHTEPYQHYFTTLQSFPWLESSLGYTQLKPDDGWSARLNTKIRLHQESAYLPQIALGIRNFHKFSGNDKLAGEYLVASKRYYNWDFTLGLGWGYFATGTKFKNPLRILGSHFGKRKYNSNSIIRTDAWFRGAHAALFAGVSYQTGIPGLTLKLELDPNDHHHELSNTYQPSRSPLNIGLTYQPKPSINLSIGVSGGDTLTTQAVLYTDLHHSTPTTEHIKKTEPNFREPSQDALKSIVSDLKKAGFRSDYARIQQQTLTIQGTRPNLITTPQTLGRIARIASEYLSDKTIPKLHYIEHEQGLATSSTILPRWKFAKATAYQSSPEETWQHTRLLPPPANLADTTYSDCTSTITPELRQHLTSSEGYYHQFQAHFSGLCQLAPHWSLTGTFVFNISDNLSRLPSTQNTQLAAVRRDRPHYTNHGIENLALHYQWKPDTAWYARASIGLLEDMYAGISTEFLYRPYDQPWAFGVDLHHVRKRDINQLIDLQDYQTITGHLSGYYHVATQNLDIKLSVGRYLAQDIGATLDIAHHFTNGTQVGIYATLSGKSDIRYQDKGIYLSLPLTPVRAGHKQPHVQLRWQSLTHDHGQSLQHSRRLYPLTRNSTAVAIARDWHTLLN
jgi:hypothetical protein